MNSKYLLSYTTVSLQVHEAKIIANLYKKTFDWVYVKKEVVEYNALQKGTITTRKREFIEFKKRVQALTSEQLDFYQNASSSDVKLLTMLSCFKLYKLIYDLSVTEMPTLI